MTGALSGDRLQGRSVRPGLGLVLVDFTPEQAVSLTLEQDRFSHCYRSPTFIGPLLKQTRNLFDADYRAVAVEFPGSDPVGQSGDSMTAGVTFRFRF